MAGYAPLRGAVNGWAGPGKRKVKEVPMHTQPGNDYEANKELASDVEAALVPFEQEEDEEPDKDEEERESEDD